MDTIDIERFYKALDKREGELMMVAEVRSLVQSFLTHDQAPRAEVTLDCGVSYASFVEGLKEVVAMWRETGHNLPLKKAKQWYACADQLEEYINGDYSVIERKKHS